MKTTRAAREVIRADHTSGSIPIAGVTKEPVRRGYLCTCTQLTQISTRLS